MDFRERPCTKADGFSVGSRTARESFQLTDNTRVVYWDICEGRTMTKVDQIGKEIEKLSQEERNALRDWFLALDARAWDKEIAADAAAGKLDQLAGEALQEYRAGKTTSM